MGRRRGAARCRGPKQEACPLQRGQCADDRGCIAGHDTGRFSSERARIIGLSNEGVTSDSVLLAALHDELDASPTIRLGVPRTELLRRTIDDKVDLAKQLIQRSSHPQASLLHGPDMLLGPAKQNQSLCA